MECAPSLSQCSVLFREFEASQSSLSQNKDRIFEGRVVILYKSDRHSVCISALSNFYKSIWLS